MNSRTRRKYIKYPQYGGNLPPNVHLPNKNEAKLLRKIKAETGLSEEEIRNEVKYRRMLSDAQKAPTGKSKIQRKVLSILKTITKELKLPKEHPKVVEKLRQEIELGRVYGSYWLGATLPLEHLMSLVGINYQRVKRQEKNK